MKRRPIARAALAAGLLLLGGVAARRLPLTYAPETTFPLLSVWLSLPESADVQQVTQRWVVPIEAEVRAMGEVEGLRGEVSTSGAWMQVLLAPATDPELKAARLTSRLAWLRGRLPGDASLSVQPAAASGDDLLAFVWLAGQEDARLTRQLADTLQTVGGVRNVEVYGASLQEWLVRLRPASRRDARLAQRLETRLRQALRVRRLGEVELSERRIPLLSSLADPARVDRLAVRHGSGTVTLGSVADVELRTAEPQRRARYRGQRGVTLLLYKEHGTSLIDADRALRQRLTELDRDTRYAGRISILRSEADALRELLRDLGLGALIAVAWLVLAGASIAGPRVALGLAWLLPLCGLAALNAFWIAGLSLNVLTLNALALALAAAVPCALLRMTRDTALARGATFTLIVCAALLPVAIALGAGRILPGISEPARAFFVAVLAAAVTGYLFAPEAGPGRRSRWVGRRQRELLRDPLTVLLIAGTLALVLLTWFGSGWSSGSSSLQPDPTRLSIRVSLPEGTTLDETERHVAEIESRLGRIPAIESFWTLLGSGSATITIELTRSSRRPDRVQRLRTLLAYKLPPGIAAIQPAYLSGAAGGGGAVFGADFEDRAETDSEAWRYRVILRSTDLDLLRRAYDELRARALRLGIRGSDIRPEWNVPSPRYELVPRPGATPDRLVRLADYLRQRTTPPRPIELPGETDRSLVVLDGRSPERPGDVPTRRALLETPWNDGERLTAPGTLVRLTERVTRTSVPRQSGRFVLPVTVRINIRHDERRAEQRVKLDRSFSLMSLPAGCDLERPELEQRRWTPQRISTVALAALLPVLLFAVAACTMNSLVAAVGALVPGALALAAVTPLLRLGRVPPGGMTLFVVAAMLCATLPLSLAVMAAAAGRARSLPPPQAVYRVMRPATAPSVLGAVFIALMLGAAGALGDATRFPWAGPLRVGAVAGGVAAAAALLVVPPLTSAALTWVRRDRAALRRRRHPPQWRDARAVPRLAVRSLTKIYPDGTRALVDVGFDLQPGIVGLLGPNGAGKTTLLRLLTGLLQPTRGGIEFRGAAVDAENFAEFRRHIGFLPQNFGTHATLTATQFLDHWALERGIGQRDERQAAIERVLDLVGLTAEADRRVSDYSGGMRRRVGIALALLADPQVLIVDEPTTGLDLESRIRFRETLLRVARKKIVIFSTHIASDVEAVASRLLMLHGGRLRFDGTPAAFLQRAEGCVFQAVVRDAEVQEFTRRYRTSARVRILEGIRVRAIVPSGETPPGKLVRPNLEEAYLAEVAAADRERGRHDGGGRFSFLDAVR